MPTNQVSPAGVVYWHTLKCTTIKLPGELDAQIRHEAARRGLTISELTREAIQTHQGAGKRRTLLAAAASHSGQHDVS